MAGTKTTLPANASTDWSNFTTITQLSYRSFMSVGLTNQFTTGVPAISAYSYAVVNGSMYSLTPSSGGDEAISTTGLSTGFTSGELWIKAVPTTGDDITCEFTTLAPTWSQAKGGYYSTGNDKYLGGVYKTTSSYMEAWTYEAGKQIAGSENRPILDMTMDIGVWDMNADAIKNVSYTHRIEKSRIINFSAQIRRDTTAGDYYPLDYAYAAADIVIAGGIGGYSHTEVDLTRSPVGLFQSSTLFDSTTINRGTLTIQYRG